MCDGGYTKQGLNYIINTGIEKEGDFDYPWYTNWGFAKPSKRRCTQKLDTRYKLGASDMNGDTWDNLPLSEGRAAENMWDKRFTEPQGKPLVPTITRTELVKEVIYANGPVGFSMNVFHSFMFHGSSRWDYWRNPCKGKLYSHDPATSCCHQELKRDCWGWWCKDNSNKCNAASGGHAMKIVGWGGSGNDEYWLVENSWGKKWHDSGRFKMRIKNNGLTGYWGNYVQIPRNDKRRALHTIATRHLQESMDAEAPLAHGARHRRHLTEADIDGIERRLDEESAPPAGTPTEPENAPGAAVTVPTDRWDVKELAQAAMGCDVSAAGGEGAACSQANATGVRGAYAGYTLKRVLQSTSQVVQGSQIALIIEAFEEKTKTSLLLDVKAVVSPEDNSNYTIFIRYANGTAEDYLAGNIDESAWSSTDTFTIVGVGGGAAGLALIVLAALRYVKRKREGSHAAAAENAGL